jgi:serine/threonine protein kinase
VAIKVLSLRFALDPTAVGRFRAEAQAVNRIRHPNIVDISDFGQLPDGRPYIVMELLEGEPLSERLHRGRMSFTEAWPLLRQGLGALEAAHRAGIVHRDLKPDNLFIHRQHDQTSLKLLDFGIAKLRSGTSGVQATVDGQLLGTPLYMSPEQALGKALEVAPSSDIYSIGVVLYEMLTGRPPFVAESLGMLIVMHAQESPPPPSLHANVDPRLEAILLRCLDKDPARRFESAAALSGALAEVAAAPLGSDTEPAIDPFSSTFDGSVSVGALHSPTGAPAALPPHRSTGVSPSGPREASGDRPLAPPAPAPLQPPESPARAPGADDVRAHPPLRLVGALALGVAVVAAGATAWLARSPAPLPARSAADLPLPDWPRPLLEGKELP